MNGPMGKGGSSKSGGRRTGVKSEGGGRSGCVVNR